jgi:hypothetical protein
LAKDHGLVIEEDEKKLEFEAVFGVLIYFLAAIGVVIIQGYIGAERSHELT